MIEFLEFVLKNPQVIQSFGSIVIALFVIAWVGRAINQLSQSFQNTSISNINQLNQVKQAIIQLSADIQILHHLVDWSSISKDIEEAKKEAKKH